MKGQWFELRKTDGRICRVFVSAGRVVAATGIVGPAIVGELWSVCISPLAMKGWTVRELSENEP